MVGGSRGRRRRRGPHLARVWRQPPGPATTARARGSSAWRRRLTYGAAASRGRSSRTLVERLDALGTARIDLTASEEAAALRVARLRPRRRPCCAAAIRRSGVPSRRAWSSASATRPASNAPLGTACVAHHRAVVGLDDGVPRSSVAAGDSAHPARTLDVVAGADQPVVEAARSGRAGPDLVGAHRHEHAGVGEHRAVPRLLEPGLRLVEADSHGARPGAQVGHDPQLLGHVGHDLAGGVGRGTRGRRPRGRGSRRVLLAPIAETTGVAAAATARTRPSSRTAAGPRPSAAAGDDDDVDTGERVEFRHRGRHLAHPRGRPAPRPRGSRTPRLASAGARSRRRRARRRSTPHTRPTARGRNGRRLLARGVEQPSAASGSCGPRAARAARRSRPGGSGRRGTRACRVRRRTPGLHVDDDPLALRQRRHGVDGARQVTAPTCRPGVAQREPHRSPAPGRRVSWATWPSTTPSRGGRSSRHGHGDGADRGGLSGEVSRAMAGSLRRSPTGHHRWRGRPRPGPAPPTMDG